MRVHELSCQFEKLLEEIRCYIGEDNLTFI